MRNFTVKLLVFACIITAAQYCWNRFMPEYFVQNAWIIPLFFTTITLVFHLLTMRSAKGDPQRFIRFYMGSTAIRMLLCIVVIVIYRFADKEGVLPFALAFMAQYIFFTIFEVSLLLKELRK